MLKTQIIGAEAVARNLGRTIPRELRRRVGVTVRMLGLSLERRVKLQKLQGQVLHRRSGRLVRSINTRFRESATVFTASVGTALSYGRAWELGFTVPARIIRPVKKRALYWLGARHPVRMVVQRARRVSARPFLRPALEEMRATIRAELSAALRGL